MNCFHGEFYSLCSFFYGIIVFSDNEARFDEKGENDN